MVGDVFWLAARFGDHVANIPSCTLCYQHGGRSLQKGKKPWGCVVAVYPLRKRGLASTGRPSAPQRAFCRLLLAGGLGINPAGGSKVGWVMPLGSPSELCGAGACWEQPLVPTISPVGERVPARVQRAEVIWPFPKG